MYKSIDYHDYNTQHRSPILKFVSFHDNGCYTAGYNLCSLLEFTNAIAGTLRPQFKTLILFEITRTSR